MDKEELENIVTEGMIIAKIKEDMFNIIKNFKSKSNSYISDEKIIAEINDIPISTFKDLIKPRLFRCDKEIKNIINTILRKLV